MKVLLENTLAIIFLGMVLFIPLLSTPGNAQPYPPQDVKEPIQPGQTVMPQVNGNAAFLPPVQNSNQPAPLVNNYQEAAPSPFPQPYSNLPSLPGSGNYPDPEMQNLLKKVQPQGLRANLPMLGAGGNYRNVVIDQRATDQITQIFRGVMAIRGLPATPRNEALVRKILDIPVQTSDLLQLRKFPVLPRFQARPDENVLRDRSFDNYEYREFGLFQTKLDGWIKPSTLETNVDFKFRGRGKTYVTVQGVLNNGGTLTGTLLFEGADPGRNLWNLKIECKKVMLRDDGFPSGGWFQVSGWDPTGKNMVFVSTFPVPSQDAVAQPQKGKKVPNLHRSSR